MTETQASENRDMPQETAPVALPAEPATLSGQQLERAMEALLFVACEPLTGKALAKLLETGEAQINQAAAQLQADYTDRGMELRRVAGGWQLVTPEVYAPLVRKLYQPKFQQLSTQALETLSIIAYRQPITRAEVSAIRQVDCDGVIATLLEKKLICEVGRVNAAGRAILYGTGQDFLRFFGLDSLSQLPPLPEDPSPGSDLAL